MWYTVPMPDLNKTEAGVARQPAKRVRMFEDFAISGRVLAHVVRSTVPSPVESRATLIMLRRDFGMTRGHAAAFLAVAEGTVKAWENGTRCPSALARHCIQAVSDSLRNKTRATLLG